MNGILIINKPKKYTSRDIVNIISKTLNTKKVGHTGTLDPMAAGVLVICLGKALKICELISAKEKEYTAGVRLGIETDTLDIDTNSTILNEVSCHIEKEKIEEILLTYKKTYYQEVPKYSAVKVNGRKLYEYARSNKEVELPKKEVTISNINLLDGPYYNDSYTDFKFNATVSEGTYIRSLIRDIGKSLNVPAVMTSLIRTRQGNFSITDAYTLDDIKNGNYKIISVLDALPQINTEIISKENLKKVLNGAPIDKFKDKEEAFLLDEDNNLIALYKNEEKYARAYKMFI